jgi:hypothetical protein
MKTSPRSPIRQIPVRPWLTIPRALMAACLLSLFGATAAATTICVHDSSGFLTALNAASTGGGFNGTDNSILLAAGTYATAGSTFIFNTGSGHALVIEGGYDAACGTQDPTPGATVLDGGGNDLVLELQSNGALTVRHLTIQHGFRHGGDGGGAQIFLTDPAATAYFDHNVVRSNSTDYGVGGLVVFGSAGTVHIDDNLFAANTAPFSAAMYVALAAYLTNNTIVGNVSANAGAATISLGDSSVLLTGYASNNISYGNTASYDFFLYSNSVKFTNNDYTSIDGAPTADSSGNLIGVDPLFFGADDYHLGTDSPLRGTGNLLPDGGLAASDLDGLPRSMFNEVDIGAYQHVERVFANGFEP